MTVSVVVPVRVSSTAAAVAASTARASVTAAAAVRHVVWLTGSDCQVFRRVRIRVKFSRQENALLATIGSARKLRLLRRESVVSLCEMGEKDVCAEELLQQEGKRSEKNSGEAATESKFSMTCLCSSLLLRVRCRASRFILPTDMLSCWEKVVLFNMQRIVIQLESACRCLCN